VSREQDERGAAPPPRWREDFPVRWDDDRYMTRRELAKFLTLGSGLIAGANVLVAAIGLGHAPPAFPERPIARVAEVPPGSSRLFRYPTAEDPCILVRDAGGAFHAFSQVCTHLACAVVYRAEARTLDCPCHRGVFAAGTGRPLAGPPTRALPRIVLVERAGTLVATRVEV